MFQMRGQKTKMADVIEHHKADKKQFAQIKIDGLKNLWYL
jgi:hypothetical protein